MLKLFEYDNKYSANRVVNFFENGQSVSASLKEIDKILNYLEIEHDIFVYKETILKYIVRVTKDNEDYDVDTGKILYYATNLSPNKTVDVALTVDNSTFDKGDGVYRISMYA